MKLEKLKTTILFCLVLISIVLTTRIWLDISIEGIFIMPKNNKVAMTEEPNSYFDEASLIKPEKLILNNSGKHTLIFNDASVGSIYSRITSDAEEMLKSILGSKSAIQYEIHPLEYLNKLRLGRNVEINFPFSYDAKLLADLLGVKKGEGNDIKSIDSILVAFESNTFYIVDKNEGSIYEYKSEGQKSNIKFMADILNSNDTNSYIFLNDVDPQKYGQNVIIPIFSAPYKLPKLSATSEIEYETAEKIAEYFFDADISSLRSIVEPTGTIIYTYKAEKGLKIDKNGFIEYMSYSYPTKSQKSAWTLKDAVNIATGFINSHLGFPQDAYISSIEPVILDGKLESCIIRYNYRYEGIPIVSNNIVGMDNPIEVEVVGGEVKRYKRLVRNIKETEEMKDIKKPLDIVDIVYKRLLQDKSIDEDDIIIKDVYLSYLEYSYSGNISMMPVWIVYVESSQKKSGKYIMNAESGVILSEPY